MEEKTEEGLAQLQLLEQGIQNLLLQKQMLQAELVETESALSELKTTTQEYAFKMVGLLMFKTTKKKLIPELEKKCELINLRIKAIEKQEQELKTKLIKKREELVKRLKGQTI